MHTSIASHYSHPGLVDTIRRALQTSDKDLSTLTQDDLAPLDQFHTRGKRATLELAQVAGLQVGMTVLDVGGGLGGPARPLASEWGCHVTVLDLTEEYCRAGEMLTQWTGLSDHVEFFVGDALALPFPDQHFDLVWTQHSSMNIPDKGRLYREAYRVLRPGGRLAIHEVMAGPVQPVHYPTPWASNPDFSFLEPPHTLRSHIQAAGFHEVMWRDVTDASTQWFTQRAATLDAASLPPLGLHLLLGETFVPAFQNIARNLAEKRIVVAMGVFGR